MGKKLFKIVIAGEGGVGKTSLIACTKNGKYRENEEMTVGVNIDCFSTGSFKGIMQLWDLGGQKRFEFLHDGYTGDVHAGILVFDLSRIKTFFELEKWEQVIRHGDNDIPIILVGNKYDLIEAGKTEGVSQEDIEEIMKRNNYFAYFNTSCKTGKNVKTVFEKLAGKLGNGCS